MGPEPFDAEERPDHELCAETGERISPTEKPIFPSYEKPTFGSPSVKKSPPLSASATRRGVTFKERARNKKQLEKIPGISARSGGYQLQTGRRPSDDLPPCLPASLTASLPDCLPAWLPGCQHSYICSERREAEHAQRSRVIAPPLQRCTFTHEAARTRGHVWGAALLKDALGHMHAHVYGSSRRG